MTAAWEVIDSQTLSSATASVTFSSIPSGYRDLIIVCDATASGQIGSVAYLNADTGSNYNVITMSGNGSTTSSLSLPNTNISLVGRIGTTKGVAVIQFMDYSATDKHKNWLSRANNTAYITEAIAGRWANTSAVTSVELSARTETYSAGSTFTLYGSNRA